MVTTTSTLVACLAAVISTRGDDFPPPGPQCDSKFNVTIGWCGGGAPVISGTKQPDPTVCCAMCANNTKCKSWTVNTAGMCYLKSFVPEQPIGHHGPNCTSGQCHGCPPQPEPKPPPPPPPAPLPPLPPAPKGTPMNVLFIAVDDLRPELGPYQFKNAPATPALDKFAKSGTTFLNAYIQYSFCCPSRNSFMSGRRPSKTKVWNFIDNFREVGIGDTWVSMPGWFKDYGYYVHGMGKLYHPGLPPNNDGNLSWTDPDRYSQQGMLPQMPGISTDPHALRSSLSIDEVIRAAGCITGEPGGSYCEINSTVGPDDSLMQAAVQSVAILANFTRQTGRPFFLGVGFHKPHIPWTIPTRFFNKSIEETDLPQHPGVPTDMPDIAWNRGLGHNALDSYKDANQYPLHPNVTFPDSLVRAMRRGYYAAVSYLDWMTGNVLDALDTTGLADSTLVIFMGDHGYQLGEHNLWCKMTVFELGTRVPLIIRMPHAKSSGTKSTALVEAVDLFPTMIDVATNQTVPNYADGVSLKPLLTAEATSVKTAAFSEFVKCYSCCKVPDDAPCNTGGAGGRCFTPGVTDPNDLREMETCFHVPREQIDFIGYSMRTTEYRYIEWLHFNGTILHGDFNRRVAIELYDHRSDDGTDPDISENINIAATADRSLLGQLHQELVAGFPVPPLRTN